jgi:electron transfer flavoprotein alpha subunit
MREIFVLTEHRQGLIRDITYEMLTGAGKLAATQGGHVTAILLGSDLDPYVEKLKGWAHRILKVDAPQLNHFNSEYYQKVLVHIITEQKPFITLIPQTGFGMDLAPSLAVELDLPLTTDCVSIHIEQESLKAMRQLYGGKVNAHIDFTEKDKYLFTVRPAAFTAEDPCLSTELKDVAYPLKEDVDYRKFIEYVESAIGDVDISQADIVVGVGRGIKEKENMPLMKELADTLGGVLACSRPVVDAGWLTKDRQVGSSGKSIKPKLYIALGISGAFQHTSGFKGAETVVAVNKDSNAPIFGEADYGIVGDLFKVVPVLTEKLKELKAS